MVVTGTATYTTATFINYQTVVCTAPAQGSYRVALSNYKVGVNASVTFDFLAFDSTCAACTATDDCSILVGSLWFSSLRKKKDWGI